MPAMWVWRCEDCGTTTYLVGAGPLFTCACPMEAMTVGLLKDGEYAHVGYVTKIAGAREMLE